MLRAVGKLRKSNVAKVMRATAIPAYSDWARSLVTGSELRLRRPRADPMPTAKTPTSREEADDTCLHQAQKELVVEVVVLTR